MNDKFSPPLDDTFLKSLAQRVDDNRADLISRYQQTLRETLFTNRSELHPGELARIAVEEVDALVSLLLHNSLSSAREHGAALCKMGLSKQAAFGLLEAAREFFVAHFQNDFAAWNIFAAYQALMIDGFTESSEKRMLSEQEAIRSAFQIALDHSTEKIKESEERYRSLVEISPDMIGLLDLNGNLIMVNKAGVELFKYETTEEMIGKNMLVAIAPDNHALIVDTFQKILETGSGRNIEFIAIRKDGTTFSIAFNSSVIFDAHGKAEAVMIEGRDITFQKQTEQLLQEKVAQATSELQRANERLNELLTYSPAILYAAGIGEGYPTTFISGNIFEQLGYLPEQFLSDPDFTFSHIHPQDEQRVRSEAEHIFENRQTVLEYRIRHQDGEYRWVRDAMRLVHSDEGLPLEIVGSWVDITERRQAETALHESEERFSAAFHASPVGFIISTFTEGMIVDANDAACLMTGYSHDDLIGNTIHGLNMWIDANARDRMIKRLLEENHMHNEEVGIRIHSGEIRIFQISMEPIQLNSKPFLISLALDITDRKRAEEALRESEEKFRAIIEQSRNGVMLIDEQGYIIEWNRAQEQITGIMRTEALGQLAWNIQFQMVLPAYRDQATAERFKQTLLEILETGQSLQFDRPIERAIQTASGESGTILQNAFLIKTGKGYRPGIIVQDITERKRMEEALHASEERFSTAFHASPVAQTLTVLESGLMLDVNEAFCGLMGYTHDELIGHTSKALWMNFKDRRSIFNQLNPDNDLRNMELQFVNRSGQLRNVLVSMAMTELKGKACIISTLVDITERVQIESALQESEQRYRALAEASHDIIFVIDRDDHIVYVNSFASIQLGTQPDALIGQPRSHWFGKSDTDKMLKGLKQAIETGKSQYAEAEIVFPRGKIYLSTWLVPLKDQSGVTAQVLGVSRDITGLKKLERSLKKTNLQLEARVEKRTAELRSSHNRLRELTQQIVVAQEAERRRISRELHDEAGQALIGLRFNLDAIYRELPANPRKIRQRMAKALAHTDQTIQRIRTLAYNLRPPTLDLLGINLGIKELCREFSEQAGLKVEYSESDLEGLPDEISISLYRFMQEALTNVAKHASASKVQVVLKYQDEMITASVQDDGRGIPDGKKYSGLGMMGIKERFDALGGRLEVIPVIPKGTQIQVCLPWKSTAN